MKDLMTRSTCVVVCALVLAAAAVALSATGRGARAAAGDVTGGTSPVLTVDDRWSYYGGVEDAAAFSRAVSAPGAAAEPGVQYVWGRLESCLNCGRGGAAAFSEPGTVLVEMRDGDAVAVTVCCGSKTVKLGLQGESAVTALRR